MLTTGPAPAGVTDHIYDLSTKLKEYHTCPGLKIDLAVIGTQTFQVDGHDFVVDVVDSVADYAAFMAEIFDFAKIKSFVSGGFKMTANAMHGGESIGFNMWPGGHC